MDLKNELIIFSRALHTTHEEDVFYDKFANRVINLISAFYEMPIPYIISSSRKVEHVLPRQLFIYVLVNNGYTLHSAGALIGRDHSTAIHCVKAIQGRLFFKTTHQAKKINELLELLS
jgi:chromosomal replication initiation ATPase DnaA